MDASEKQFEAMLDAELRTLDGELRHAMKAPAVSAEVVEGIARAVEVKRALRVDVPSQLTHRIFTATAPRLRRKPVLARIGPATRFAAAAAIFVALGLGAWVVMNTEQPASLDFASLGLDQFTRDLDEAPAPGADVDTRLLAFAVELDQLAFADDADAYPEFVDDAANLAEDLELMEADLDVF